jgi:tetratricopeptide (TPR) repeat protein
MLHLIARVIRQSLLLAGCGVMCAALVGCADIVTYSQDSQQKGMQYYNAGQYTDAAGAFSNAVKQAPGNYEARYYLANSYAQTGSYEKAIQSYRAALDSMKLTYAGQRDTALREKIIDGLARAVAQSPNRHTELAALEEAARGKSNAEDYIILAKASHYAGDPDGAMEHYNHAALLAPDDFQVQKQHGLYLDSLGQSTATTPLRRANALNPEDAEVASALRKYGVIPGPSLKQPHELAKPLMPDGPIPDWNPQWGRKPAPQQPGATASNGASPSPYPTPTATVQNPRD